MIDPDLYFGFSCGPVARAATPKLLVASERLPGGCILYSPAWLRQQKRRARTRPRRPQPPAQLWLPLLLAP
jgi:hypothetical protein